MNISELLSSGYKALKINKIETHQLDSELILSNLLKTQREDLIIHSSQKVSKNINRNKFCKKSKRILIVQKKYSTLQ